MTAANIIPVFDFLSVTDHKDDSALRLTCSVSTNKKCQYYTVRWLDEQNQDLTMSPSPCSASVTFTAADRMYASGKDEFLKCRVTFGENVQEFPFRIQSAQKMGEKIIKVLQQLHPSVNHSH